MTAIISFDSASVIRSLPSQPGVYLMLNGKGEIIYVGKAKNLKKRVSSYFQKTHANIKTSYLVTQIQDIQVTLTSSELEAFLLEINLIKKYRPRYNVYFRDDKTYPYLYMSSKDDFPRLSLYRGVKNKSGDYFGPYPNKYAARETVRLLQKLFKLRVCEDTFFRNRSRPCLQYQIKRCSAPCVGYIDKIAYQEAIKHTQWFLQGKSQTIVEQLMKQMEAAADQQAYEEAGRLRDQIAALNTVQQPQAISHTGTLECDVIGLVLGSAQISVGILSIREGQICGSYHYFLPISSKLELKDVWSEFLPQYYLGQEPARMIPPEIIVNEDFPDRAWLAKALSEAAKQKVIIKSSIRGIRQQWVTMAIHNAKDALQRQLLSRANSQQRLAALASILHLPSLPGRIECFDVSHFLGEATQASCVVFNEHGPLKSDYRRYNIEGITPGDDYGALRQVLTRRYSKQEDENKLPDLILIDGGKGQLHAALTVLMNCGLPDILLVGVAKGADRKPGLETLFIHNDDTPINLPSDSPALHLIQEIRDEAHRFAITGHRRQRQKNRKESPLSRIPGIGPKRRQQLVSHFGGWQGVKAAGINELARVPGISRALAEAIHAALQLPK